MAWAERQPILLEAFSRAGVELIEHARKAAKKGQSRAARDYSVAAAVCSDKASLLGGGVTARTELLSWHAEAAESQHDEQIKQLDAKIEAMQQELDEMDGDDAA